MESQDETWVVLGNGLVMGFFSIQHIFSFAEKKKLWDQ